VAVECSVGARQLRALGCDHADAVARYAAAAALLQGSDADGARGEPSAARAALAAGVLAALGLEAAAGPGCAALEGARVTVEVGDVIILCVGVFVRAPLTGVRIFRWQRS
jgi:hypothetical protein